MKLFKYILSKQIFLIILFTLTALGQKDDAGTTTASFLKLGVGARAAALGYSAFALSEDASALYYNPAALADIPNVDLTLNYNHFFADMKHSFMGLTIPSGNAGTLGLGLLFFTSGNMTRTEAIPSGNLPFSKNGEFANYDGSLMLGYGVNVYENIHFGFTLKGIFQYLGEEVGYGGAGDVGIFAKIQMFDVGLAVRNIGTKIKFKDIEQELPLQILLGTSVRLLQDNLLLTLSGGSIGESNTQFNFGAEYKYQFVSFRAGYRTGLEDISGSLKGLTGGLGLNYQSIRLDYAYNTFGDFGGIHLISLGFQMGSKSISKSPSEDVAPPPVKTYEEPKKVTEPEKKIEPEKPEIKTPEIRKSNMGIIIPSNANLYTQPSTKSRVTARTVSGDKVKILDERETWYLVEASGQKQGWIQKKDVKLEE